jgi:Phage integrase, N-terminal SAM-like domain
VKAGRHQVECLLEWAIDFPDRRWAIESANGLGFLLAQQLVAAGEDVVDVPPTLAARVRVLGSGKTQKNEPIDALSTAIAALRAKRLRTVVAEDHSAVLRLLVEITARETFATKTDASLWLDSNGADKASGLRVDPRAGEITLGDYAREWLAHRVGLAKRTQEIYASQLRLHILPLIDTDLPALGMVKLVDLTPALVRAWYQKLQDQRGPSVAAKAYQACGRSWVRP